MRSDVSNIENPWLRAYVAGDWKERRLGEVQIVRVKDGFNLQHIAYSEDLRLVHLSDLPTLVNFNTEGKFRPLKSVPDLPPGWFLHVKTADELAAALQIIYPNSLADLYATESKPLPTTDYRTFTNRQTGMYRITTFLDNNAVSDLTKKVCEAICLKDRLWAISGSTGPRLPRWRTGLVCLEPCAIFLESARKEVRALQEKSAKAGQADSATSDESS